MPISASSELADLDAIDELPLPYIELDSKGFITRANRATLALHPLEHGDLIGKMAWDLMATDEKDPSFAAYVSFMESGQDPPVVFRSIYTRSGEFRIYEFHRCIKRDRDGRPSGMRMVCVDVTEAKRVFEEALRARALFESVIHSMAEAVIVTDALGFIRSANPAAEAMLGWNASAMIGEMIEKGMPLLSFVSHDNAPLNFTLSLENRCKGIATVLDQQQREVRVEISTSPMLDKESGSTTGVVSVLRKLEETG